MDPKISQAFGPICEGLDSGFGDAGACVFSIPEVICVKQGKKAWFALGESTQLLIESIDESVDIVENFEDLELVERVVGGKPIKTVKDGVWIVEGPYQRSDTKNANGRTYSRKIWERIVGNESSDAQQNIKAGGMVGHLEHPADGRMDGKEGAIVTRSLRLREDGVVWGASELLDTPNGLILQEYTRKKVRWGVSSRGNGSVDDGGKVNESDFQLVTFDAVMRPSTPGAYPQPTGGKGKRTTESANGPSSLTEDAKSCLAEVTSLREIDVEGLDESTRRKFMSDLMGQLSRVNSLGRSNGMSDEDVTELQDWLVRTLKESHEASPDTALTDIDEVLANIVADGDPEQDEAAQSVINDLQGQVESASEEVESLRAELETTQEELEAARMSDDDTFEEDLEDAKAELERVRGMLSIARDVISSQSTVEVDDAKQKAVDEAINEVAGLEDFRSALEKAVDADAVIELAEELLPAVAAKRQAARNSVTPPKPVVSRALPARGMVVESDVSGGPQRQGVNPSRGARMAGGAVRKMAAPSS